MPWTNPTTRSTGDLVTAPIWNTDLVDNLIYLKEERDAIQPLFFTGTTVPTSGTAETTCFSTTIPGGTLGTGNILHIWAVWVTTTSGSPGTTLTLRFKYGATTLHSWGLSIPSARNGWIRTDWFLSGNGFTNVQKSVMGGVKYIDSSFGHSSAAESQATGGEDSTLDKTLAITMQNSVAYNVNFMYSGIDHVLLS